MGRNEKRAYLQAIRERYLKASKLNKVAILNEFCAVCSYHRKHAIRLLHKRSDRKKKRPGRTPIYKSQELLTALQRIWLATDQMCSKKFKAAIPLWLPFYQEKYGPLSEHTLSQIQMISAPSIDRILKPTRKIWARKKLCGTKPGTLLRTHIPIRTHNWDITEPGFLEADTVAHCGNSLAGSFAWSLTLTDILTGWTECRIVWNKGAYDIVKQIRNIESKLPFPLKGFDCDNGSEFLNYHLVRYFTEHQPVVSFTRSRPYKKNDNAHVEQKNWTHVRQLFGYHRIENQNLLEPINNLYMQEWSLFQNHFCPTLKLQTKTRINSKYHKTYEPPKTPYQRIIESNQVPQDTKQQLRDIHSSLNPFTLRDLINKKLKSIFESISVTSFVSQRTQP